MTCYPQRCSTRADRCAGRSSEGPSGLFQSLVVTVKPREARDHQKSRALWSVAPGGRGCVFLLGAALPPHITGCCLPAGSPLVPLMAGPWEVRHTSLLAEQTNWKQRPGSPQGLSAPPVGLSLWSSQGGRRERLSPGKANGEERRRGEGVQRRTREKTDREVMGRQIEEGERVGEGTGVQATVQANSGVFSQLHPWKPSAGPRSTCLPTRLSLRGPSASTGVPLPLASFSQASPSTWRASTEPPLF